MARVKPRTLLIVEQLEDRCVPANFGNPWPDGSHLTLSFAPDGTKVGDNVSTLFQTFNSRMATQTWQTEMLRAFQTWAVQANLNIGLVADSGLPFGSSGIVQGDARFGDLRLAAYGMASSAVAIGSPFDPTAGTWSGDVKLNSLHTFGTEGLEGYDLFSVVVHEAGHALGLPGNNDPQSVMYETYLAARPGLSSADIDAIRALYGARERDQFEKKAGNDVINAATRLTVDAATKGSAVADITTTQDVDFFTFTAGGKISDTVTIRLKTAGMSLLTARLTVFNSANEEIHSAFTTNPLDNDLTITLREVRAKGTYYIKVESAQNNVFGVGSYQLSVESGASITTADQINAYADDGFSDDRFSKATTLSQKVFTTDRRFDYVYYGTIRDQRDVDFYTARGQN